MTNENDTNRKKKTSNSINKTDNMRRRTRGQLTRQRIIIIDIIIERRNDKDNRKVRRGKRSVIGGELRIRGRSRRNTTIEAIKTIMMKTNRKKRGRRRNKIE